MQAILQSGDPYAILELSGLLEQDVPPNTSYGRFAGNRRFGYAWQFVACDLGMDCSWNSYIVRQMCMNGICGNGSLKDVVQQVLLPPADFQQTVKLEMQILQLYETSDFEQLFSTD